MTIIHTHIPKRKKRKPTAKQRDLKASWEEIIKKYEPKKKVECAPYKAPQPYRRETVQHKSVSTTGVAECNRRESPVYTGSNMIGIATLHKSNAVPVFSQEDAKEISRMRRG